MLATTIAMVDQARMPSGTAELVGDFTSVAPGTTVHLGVRLRPGPGCHTYWKNPGDSGGPPSFQFKLPKNWTVGAAIWPVPERLDLSGVVSYGFGSPILVSIPVKVPADQAAGSIRLTAKVKWLTCTSEICRPADREVSLKLEVGKAKRSPNWAEIQAEERVAPRPYPGEAKVVGSAQNLSLTMEHFHPGFIPTSFYFFPAATGLVDHSAAQQFTLSGDTLVGVLPRSPYASMPPKRVFGVLKAVNGSRCYAVSLDAPVVARLPSRS